MKHCFDVDELGLDELGLEEEEEGTNDGDNDDDDGGGGD